MNYQGREVAHIASPFQSPEDRKPAINRLIIKKKMSVQKGNEFAFLTNSIHQEWTGITVKKTYLIAMKA
jgi:hypothetical protein